MDPEPTEQGTLHTFKTDEEDPVSVMPRGQNRLQISLEKREYHRNPDDSRHRLPPSDAPADGNLFNKEESQAAWNNTLLHKLLSSLDHTLELLHKQVESDNLDCPYLRIVPKYFQRIHLYLKEKEYSPCAWEVIRGEIKVFLSLM